MKSKLFYIVYDSIGQPLFESQLFNPLRKRLDSLGITEARIISFEPTLTPALIQLQKEYSYKDPRITIALYKRPQRLHLLFLQRLAARVQRHLRATPLYHLIARGPFAGWIARKALTKNCCRFTLQARGLVAEEHAYAHKDDKGLKKLLHKAYQHRLFMLEQAVYRPFTKKNTPFEIEVVSPALAEYLTLTYKTPSSLLTEASFDQCEPVPFHTKLEARKKIRTALAIPENAPVFVYSGTLKPWQCPQETVALFCKEWKENNEAVLLLLSPDLEAFNTLLKKVLPTTAYRLLSVAHSSVVEYLCAADYGIVLREKHLMNWVSRPTKLLEYQAAGLTVLHNKTIGLLID